MLKSVLQFPLCYISGNFTDGPFSFEENLLGSLLTFIGCNPGESKMAWKIKFLPEPEGKTKTHLPGCVNK